MDVRDVESMLGEDRAEWEALVALLEARGGVGNVHADSAPSWTSRDVFAHLARWIAHSTADLEGWLEGRPIASLDGSDEEINARWQAEDSALDVATARERAQSAFDRRVRAIESVPAERWADAALVKIARADGAEHYRAHREYLSS